MWVVEAGKWSSMKLPLQKVARFVKSPQGRQAIERARAWYETPENRRKVDGVVGRFRPPKRQPGTGA
jgi:hypothetical protein